MNKEMMMAKANEVVKALENDGYKAETAVINKNGVEKIGITVGNGSIRPTVYPNFEQDVVDIVEMIKKVNAESTPDAFKGIVDNIEDYEKIKETIIPYLSSGTIPDAVTRKYLDLNVYYRITGKDYSILIKENLFNRWGISEEELFAQAKENVKDGFNIRNIQDIIPIPLSDIFMKVITRESQLYGASVLLFPEVFKKIENGKPFIILPSSIHEVIVINEGEDNMGLANMIQEINRTQLAPEDILSDHPYYYDGKEIKEA